MSYNLARLGGERRMRRTRVEAVPDLHTNLRPNSINLLDSIVLSLANAAPTVGMAGALGAILAASGYGGALAVLVCGVAMLGIAVGYARLNRWDPRAGATYHWVSISISPYVGFFTGWIMLVGYLFTIAGDPFSLGPAVTSLFGVQNPTNLEEFLIGGLAIALAAVLGVVGIKPTANVQRVLMATEYAIMLLFIVLAVKAIYVDHAFGSVHPSLSWFTWHGTGGWGGLVAGVVIGVYLYSDWEANIYNNEETKERRENPGRASIIGVAIMIVIFSIFIVGFQGVTARDTIENAPAGALVVIAHHLLPSPWGNLMLIAIVEAVLATLLGNIVASARILYGMSDERDGVLPRLFARVHRRFKTPTVATWFFAALSIVILGVYLASTSFANVIGYVLGAIGVLFSLFYAITGLTCAWQSRFHFGRARELLLAGLFPTIASVFLIVIVVYTLVQNPISQTIAVLVSIAAGIPVLVIALKTGRTGYFRGSAPASNPDPEATAPNV